MTQDKIVSNNRLIVYPHRLRCTKCGATGFKNWDEIERHWQEQHDWSPCKAGKEFDGTGQNKENR